MGYLARKAVAAIQPRVKPPKPAESQTVPCPFPGEWGPGIQQARVCTFNYGLPFQWECTPWQDVGGACSPVPPKPAEQQTLPCPEGSTGTGIQQSRVCTFNYTSGVWECTNWQTDSEDCVPSAFVTNLQNFVPAFGGTFIAEGLEQTYAPPPVVVGGITMTLNYHVFVTGTAEEANLQRTSTLSISFSPAGPVAGKTANVTWDRDYASFAPNPVQPDGSALWFDIPNSEWTDNATTFTVTLT